MLMDLMNEVNTFSNGAIIGGLAIGIAAATVAKLVKDWRKQRQHSRMLGAQLRDISELAVEEMRCSLVHSTKEFRQFFAKELPFVRERLIFVVDAVVKVGFNFDDIQIKVDEWHKRIVLRVPEMKVLSNEIKFDSMETLDEKTGVFAKPQNDNYKVSMSELCQLAEDRARDWGVFERAKASARDRLTLLVGKFYDLTRYEVQVIFPDNSQVAGKPEDDMCA